MFVNSLQRRGRALFQSARVSGQYLTAASSIATHSPSQAALEQAKPLAATKASSYSRYQPLPGWLATLAVGGVAGGIVAANLEEVPLTGRMQLQIARQHQRRSDRLQVMLLCCRCRQMAAALCQAQVH